MTAPTVRVNLGPRSYDIVVTSGDLGGVGAFARQRVRGSLALVVADEHVQAHAATVATSLENAGFRTHTLALPSGEGQKCLSVAAQLYDQLAEMHADRQTLVVPVGGGVVGDLAGFAAATFNRGLPLLMAPTTLLAMVDSSVGGKVGINHPRAKNLIGAFHQPVGVWIDIATLTTLPPREYRSGLAEVVKYGVILDPDFFAYLEANADAILQREPEAVRHVVARCCRIKADVVENDEREETGLRAALNYGHTFAHAFETAAGYGAWLHGEAVAAGMICASRLAERRQLIPVELTQRQERLLKKFELPTKPEPWSIPDLVNTMRSDKKSVAGQLRFILPRRLGEVALFDDVPEHDVIAVLQSV
ncbi:MAG: 3-dehydroquinate synthase [Gemmataceae bacterium]|nr:3-dehydroquinate synthase [Gemmataceae bacterium]